MAYFLVIKYHKIKLFQNIPKIALYMDYPLTFGYVRASFIGT